MSGRDAFEDEMLFASLSDRDAERLLRGLAPESDSLAEVAEFARAARLQLVGPPAQRPALVARLAAIAGAAADTSATPFAEAAVPRRRRGVRPRPALAVKVVGILAALPLLFAGLAVADVTLPAPAREAFEAVGVELPNQPAEDDGEATPGDVAAPQPGTGDGASDSGGGKDAEKDASGSPGSQADGQGTTKSNPAREGGRAEGEQGRGRALGKRGLAPGQIQPPGQIRAPGLKKQPGGRNDAAAPPAPAQKALPQGAPQGAPPQAKAPPGAPTP